ncbi:MAG: hypothetical protein IJT94_17790 [Oscillibacter sp.]|nr:hypothetical protein [Oscillibacter sp.]
MAGAVRVIEKNAGEKIEWRQKGTKLYFGDEDLIIRCDTRQREYPVRVDICADEDGNLGTGVSGNCAYVAQIEIPGFRYTEPEETAAAEGETAAETGEVRMEQGSGKREVLPLDMAEVTLTLWNVEALRHMGALN